MGAIAIIGGGISGLSLAYFLLEKDPDLDIIIFESEKRLGGKIWTEKAEGFLCEAGVNGFLDNKPRTLELSKKVSLEPLRSNDASRKRFIYSDNRLHRLPEAPPAFLASSLMSLSGKLRIMAELVIPGNVKDEETLAAFARRRLGKEAYEKLIDPMASGIYAGNPETLSLRACFPKVYDLEARYGGLIKGMLRLQRERKKQGSSEKVGAGPGGTLTSFYNGMGELVSALRNFLGERIRLGSKVQGIDRKGSGYVLFFPDGSSIETDIVVSAAPAYAVSEMVKNMDRRLSNLVAEIPYPSLSLVCLGYRKEKIKTPVDAFGFLIPSREKRNILGTLYDSSIFPNRAPEGYVLLRSMVGGARYSDLARENDTKLVDLVKGELAAIMDIRSDPDFVRVYKHEMAIPQYTVGHLERLRNIDTILQKHKNLYLTGNAYKGIGVNDCIENSFRLAEKIIEES
ncbi:MAG: protoporphyrinogen oxidase [Nitrospira bacterium HGW-Nitrospira-1]|nr:MAG: protoporphyrinogen oxidase [Nitrospira bacterium HGW-Nitrospira-1]